MAARMGTVDLMGDGSVMHGWASYNTALSDEDIAVLADSPFVHGDPVDPPQEDPVIAGVERGADGSLQLALPPGFSGAIEYSVDLQSWEVIATDVGESFTDDEGGRNALPIGFYRALP